MSLRDNDLDLLKMLGKSKKHIIPETNIAPENGWLEDDRFLLGGLPFGGLFNGFSWRFSVVQSVKNHRP